MKLKYFLFFLLLSITLAQAQDFNYKLKLHYQNDILNLESIQVVPKEQNLLLQKGLYVAEILSFENKILNLTFFSLSRDVFYDSVDADTREINGGGRTIINDTEKTLLLPYYPQAKEINIYDANLTLLLHISVAEWSKQELSSIEISSQFGKTNTSYNKEVCSSKIFPILLWLSIGLILIIIILIIFLRIKNKNET